MCRTQNNASQLVFDDSRQMCLVDDGEHVIGSFNGVCDKTRVLDHKNVILRVRDYSGLVLGYLNNRQTLEFDDSVGD